MNIYIATKLFSFFDRRISYMMYEITENVIKELKVDNYHIFCYSSVRKTKNSRYCNICVIKI